jgi:hypothetical protein
MKDKIISKQAKKIIADVDDEIYNLKNKIQKKYNLTWKDARDYVNYSLRVLMLSSPKRWLKK